MLRRSVDVLTDAAEDAEDPGVSEDVGDSVDWEYDEACVEDEVVACCVAVAAESVDVAWLLVAMLNPLTGPAKTVAGEVNTVVVERLDPETTPVSHDSV